MVLDILKWIGIPGLLGLVGAAYFLPTVLPGVVVRGVIACVEAAMTGLGWVLATVASGMQHIAGSNAAVATLVIVSLAAGVVGDRFDPLRSQLPSWLQSAPPAAPARDTTADVADAPQPAQKPATARRKAPRPPNFEDDPTRYLTCQLGGGC
jgi:hypothetical protein